MCLAFILGLVLLTLVSNLDFAYEPTLPVLYCLLQVLIEQMLLRLKQAIQNISSKHRILTNTNKAETKEREFTTSLTSLLFHYFLPEETLVVLLITNRPSAISLPHRAYFHKVGNPPICLFPEILIKN